MRKFMRRLLRRDNIVALTLIAATLLAVFGIPQKLGISDSQIMLIMLGFLALDALVEKIGYFEPIETSIMKIDRVVAPHPNSVTVKKRKDLRRFSECIVDTNDVFISAISADSLITQYSRDIEQAYKRGTRFRFLLVAPDTTCLDAMSTSSHTNVNVDTLRRWCEDTQEMLNRIACVDGKGRVELRWFYGLPTMSIICYDGDSHDGWMQIEPHTFRRTPSDRPSFVLQNGDGNEWFQYFGEVIDELWSTGVDVPLRATKPS